MNAGGWFMMIASVGGMTYFFSWCVYKVLTTPGSTEHLHSQKDRPPDDESDEQS
jgi:hypothetical protein